MIESEFLRHPVDTAVEAVDQQLLRALAAAHDVDAGLAAVKAAARHHDVDASVAAVDTQLRTVLHVTHDIEAGLAAVKSAAKAITASHDGSGHLTSPHEDASSVGESINMERVEAQAVIDDFVPSTDDHRSYDAVVTGQGKTDPATYLPDCDARAELWRRGGERGGSFLRRRFSCAADGEAPWFLLWDTPHYTAAIETHRAALAIFREVGDRYGEGTALNNLAVALRELRRFDEAVSANESALAIFREVGDRYGEGTALNNLGSTLRDLQRFDEATTAHQQALEAYTDVGDIEAIKRLRRVIGELHT